MCEAGPPLDGYAVVRRDLTEYHLLVVAGGRCPPRRLPGLALAEQRPAVLHRAGARKGTPLQRQVHRPPGRERVGGRGRAVHARLRARARHVEDARAGDADGAGHRPTATSPYYSAEPSSSLDRKSTRLNSSHQIISYAVFCLKKKKKKTIRTTTNKKTQSKKRKEENK